MTSSSLKRCRTPGRGRTLIALLATTVALAAGEQALAPTTASAVIQEGNECSDSSWNWLECGEANEGGGDGGGIVFEPSTPIDEEVEEELDEVEEAIAEQELLTEADRKEAALEAERLEAKRLEEEEPERVELRERQEVEELAAECESLFNQAMDFEAAGRGTVAAEVMDSSDHCYGSVTRTRERLGLPPLRPQGELVLGTIEVSPIPKVSPSPPTVGNPHHHASADATGGTGHVKGQAPAPVQHVAPPRPSTAPPRSKSKRRKRVAKHRIGRHSS